MRKTLVWVLLAALLVSLGLPGVAFAEKGGNGKGHGREAAPGHTRNADPALPEVDGDVPASDQNRGNGNANGHDRTAGAHASDDGTSSVEPRQRTRTRTAEETSATPEQRRTGVENALERIEANIAKAESKMAAGTKRQIPPGLLRVMDKFLSWLGFSSETLPDPAEEGTEPAGDSAEETMTPAPIDGSDETTPNPEP